MEKISPYILPVLIGLVILIVLVSAIAWFINKRKKVKKPFIVLGPLSPEKEAQALTVAEHIKSYLSQGFDIKEMRLQAAAQEIDMEIWERAEELVSLQK